MSIDINPDDLHNYTAGLNAYSEQFMSDTCRYLRDNPPVSVGMLCDVYDEAGKLYAHGKCVGMHWDGWDWLYDVEIVTECGLEIQGFYGGSVVRHIGFMAQVVQE